MHIGNRNFRSVNFRPQTLTTKLANSFQRLLLGKVYFLKNPLYPVIFAFFDKTCANLVLLKDLP